MSRKLFKKQFNSSKLLTSNNYKDTISLKRTQCLDLITFTNMSSFWKSIINTYKKRRRNNEQQNSLKQQPFWHYQQVSLCLLTSTQDGKTLSRVVSVNFESFRSFFVFNFISVVFI